MAKIFEYESEKHMMDSIKDLRHQLYSHASDRETVLEQLKSNGEILGHEIEAKTFTGDKIWIRLNAHVVYTNDGQIDYVEGTVSDITDRNEDRKKLEKQYSSLKQYAFINSHKVRAHVSTILGLTTLCIDQIVTEEEKEKVLRHLYEESLKLDMVIRDLALLIDQEA